jgi:ElaB/YqjD/DUF883 family membrane-anchored ribosome-binding protein
MSQDPAENPTAIRERIDVERAELSQTVEALAHKVDVKARAHEKVDEIKARAHDKADEIKAKVQDTAEAAVGTAREAVGTAREAVGSAVGVARRPSVLWPLAGTMAALAAIVVIVRRIAR